jgi:hypothetical protein
LPEQVRAVAEVLAAARTPLEELAIAACFTGRGAWKKRLPQIVETRALIRVDLERPLTGNSRGDAEWQQLAGLRPSRDRPNPTHTGHSPPLIAVIRLLMPAESRDERFE